MIRTSSTEDVPQFHFGHSHALLLFVAVTHCFDSVAEFHRRESTGGMGMMAEMMADSSAAEFPRLHEYSSTEIAGVLQRIPWRIFPAVIELFFAHLPGAKCVNEISSSYLRAQILNVLTEAILLHGILNILTEAIFFHWILTSCWRDFTGAIFLFVPRPIVLHGIC